VFGIARRDAGEGQAAKGGPEQEKPFELGALSDEELWALEALLAKADVN
jgi:hypothetical protein